MISYLLRAGLHILVTIWQGLVEDPLMEGSCQAAGVWQHWSVVDISEPWFKYTCHSSNKSEVYILIFTQAYHLECMTNILLNYMIASWCDCFVVWYIQGMIASRYDWLNFKSHDKNRQLKCLVFKSMVNANSKWSVECVSVSANCMCVCFLTQQTTIKQVCVCVCVSSITDYKGELTNQHIHWGVCGQQPIKNQGWEHTPPTEEQCVSVVIILRALSLAWQYFSHILIYCQLLIGLELSPRSDL